MGSLKTRIQRLDWLAWGTHTILLSATIASLCALSILASNNPGPFAVANNALPQIRKALLYAVAGGFVGTALISVLLSLFIRQWSDGLLERASKLSAPLVLIYPIVSLLDYRAWRSHHLEFLIALGIVGLVLERCLRLSAAAVPPLAAEHWRRRIDDLPLRLRRALPLAFVLLAATGFTAFVAYFSIQQHQRLATAAFDLGIYDNLMYNAMTGRPFHSPVLFGPNGGNYIAGHAELAMLLFVPLYALKPSAETLLVLQAVLLGFAAVPLYLLAAQLVSRTAAVLIAVSYLLYAPLHGPAFYDFHWLPLAIFFHFWLYYFIATRRPWLIGVSLGILILIREDVPVGLTLLGIFLVVTRLRPRLGLLIALVSATSFIAIKFGLMPWAGKWWFSEIYKDLVADGESGYGSVIITTLINPLYFLVTLLTKEKLIYALHLYAPLLLLPLRWPALAMLSLAGFFFTLMTTGYAPTLSIAFQYTTHWIPYLFVTVVLALHLLKQNQPRSLATPAVVALTVMVTIHSLTFGAIFQHETFVGGFSRVPFKMTTAERDNYASLRELTAKIPKESSVAATENLTAHISNRVSAFTLRVHHGNADYLFVDRNNLGGNTTSMLKQAAANSKYGLLDKKGRLYLFQRGLESSETAKALRELGLGAVGSKNGE